jgi:hypothetical protein
MSSKTEKAIAYIDIEVFPVADTPNVEVKGNSIGLEDTLISIPVSITLEDRDESETYVMYIDDTSVPPGTKFFGEGGVEIFNVSGVYALYPSDVEEFQITPPLHYSSALQGDILLQTTTVVTDTTVSGSNSTSFEYEIPVHVTGVADVPNSRAVHVIAEEDELYDIGAAIGDVDTILVDRDGSEALSLILSGLPNGVQPISNITGEGVLEYLGGGEWSVPLASIPGLKLPPLKDFSGENPYQLLTMKATTQEMDGDQAESELWDLSIDVYPVIQGHRGDGFASWTLSWGTDETKIEDLGTDIRLSEAGVHSFIDNDGSEEVIEYYFDLSNLLADAQIEQRLIDLQGQATFAALRMYIIGAYAYAGNGWITVSAQNIGGMAISSELFLDSNVGFSIPVKALVRDTAIINGGAVYDEKNETGAFQVSILGTPDPPTVFAESMQGYAVDLIQMNFGGSTSDTDVALGRNESERVYYIVKAQLNTADFDNFLFLDINRDFIGTYTGQGSWLFTAEDLENQVYFSTSPLSNGTVDFEFTAIAVDGGTRALNATDFSVSVTGSTGEFPAIAPLPPTLEVGLNYGTEDTIMILNVTASNNVNETTSVRLSIAFSGVPEGYIVKGAVWNPVDEQWIASLASFEAGEVTIAPLGDFSGDFDITFEAFAINEYFLSASSLEQSISLFFQPVGDGVGMSLSNTESLEDQLIELGLSLSTLDSDGSETIGDYVYFQLSDGANLQSYSNATGSYSFYSTGTYTVYGTELVGYYRVLRSEISYLWIGPAIHWHGPLQMIVYASSVEDLDINAFVLSSSTFVINVIAEADAPLLTVPSGAVLAYENVFTLIPDLSATLVDNVSENGAESLSVTISNVPENSFFNFGANTGNGRWVIPSFYLDQLEILPPNYWSGTMNLTLTGVTYESSNFDETFSTEIFIVQVEPVASPFLILAKNVELDNTGKVPLNLNVRMLDTRGTDPGETPQEIITLTFTSVPDGANLRAGSGGRLAFNGAGEWVFTGTQDQANALEVFSGPGIKRAPVKIGISAVTQDGSDISVPTLDDFFLDVNAEPNKKGETLTANSTLTSLVGGPGNDILQGFDLGSSGGRVELSGGAGIDTLYSAAHKHIMDGGTGPDRFVWSNDAALLGETDEIVLFDEFEGDQLDLTGVMDSTFNLQTSNVNDFVNLVESGLDTTVEVVRSGAWVDVVVLKGVTGLTVDQLIEDGNLLL